MKKALFSITLAALTLGTPTAVLAKHHASGHDGHKCEKMEDGNMDHSKMDHGDHSGHKPN